MEKRAIDSHSELGIQTMRMPKWELKKMSLKLLAQCVASAAGVLRNALRLCSRRMLMYCNMTMIHLIKSLTKWRKQILDLQPASDGLLGS